MGRQYLPVIAGFVPGGMAGSYRTDLARSLRAVSGTWKLDPEEVVPTEKLVINGIVVSVTNFFGDGQAKANAPVIFS